MPVYMILDAAVHDAEPENATAYETYKKEAPQYVFRHGGGIFAGAARLTSSQGTGSQSVSS